MIRSRIFGSLAPRARGKYFPCPSSIRLKRGWFKRGHDVFEEKGECKGINFRCVSYYCLPDCNQDIWAKPLWIYKLRNIIHTSFGHFTTTLVRLRHTVLRRPQVVVASLAGGLWNPPAASKRVSDTDMAPNGSLA